MFVRDDPSFRAVYCQRLLGQFISNYPHSFPRQLPPGGERSGGATIKTVDPVIN